VGSEEDLDKSGEMVRPLRQVQVGLGGPLPLQLCCPWVVTFPCSLNLIKFVLITPALTQDVLENSVKGLREQRSVWGGGEPHMKKKV
jgi:hypothetical protein